MCLLALVPTVRVMLRPAVWRELRNNTGLAIAFAAAALAALVMSWSARSVLVTWLPPAAVLLVVLVTLAWWRARDNYGIHRGLPPGSLGLRASLNAISNQGFYAESARQHGPIFKMAQFHRPVACIVDLKIGLDVLESQRGSLRQPTQPFGRLTPGTYIEFMNDEGHARYRVILDTALSSRVIAGARLGIEDAVRVQLAACAPCGDEEGVSPRPVLERVAFASLARAMFGLLPQDPRVDEMRSLFDQLGFTRTLVEQRPEERSATFARLVAMVRSIGTDLLADSPDAGEPASSALSEALRDNHNHLDDDTLLGNLVLVAHVTRSNVRGLLNWLLKELLDHPEVTQTLRAAAAGAGSDRMNALAMQIVNETLRRHQSEYLYREVIDEVRIGPYRIPRGWLIRVCVRECHDNPAIFPAPEQFLPSRFAGRSYTRTEYRPFSDGTHSCFGAGLALMTACSLAVILSVDWEGRIISDGVAERDGNRHWSHWRPAARLRIRLTPRGAGPAATD